MTTSRTLARSISPPRSLPDRLFASYARRGWSGRGTLWRLLGRGPSDTVRVRTTHGACFALHPWSYIDRVVIEEGYYESEIIEALLPHLRAGSVLWDIGANFGLHAVTAAALAPEATVVAFEPNPTEHARLLQHRAWNSPQLVTCSLALSDADRVLPLHLGPPGNSGMTTLTPWSQASYSGTVLVPVAAGDRLIAAGHLPAPDLIKLDVEGHELAVLRGLEETLRAPRCRLVVFEDGPGESAVKQLLHDAGFAIQPLVRREHTGHTLANFAALHPSR